MSSDEKNRTLTGLVLLFIAFLLSWRWHVWHEVLIFAVILAALFIGAGESIR
jgi:hypothetical protein